MQKLKAFRFINLLRTCQKGAAAAEYALILAIVGAGIALAAANLGSVVDTAITDSATEIQNPPAPTM